MRAPGNACDACRSDGYPLHVLMVSDVYFPRINNAKFDLLGAADWPDHPGAIILVSHQPALGRLASLLLAGTEADWTIKKAGVWWFSNRVRHDETQTILRAVHNP